MRHKLTTTSTIPAAIALTGEMPLIHVGFTTAIAAAWQHASATIVSQNHRLLPNFGVQTMTSVATNASDKPTALM